jgi:hypothetical protein
MPCPLTAHAGDSRHEIALAAPRLVGRDGELAAPAATLAAWEWG